MKKVVNEYRRIGGEPENEEDHFCICNVCGQAFDMRELDQVLQHEEPGHEPLDLNS